MELGARKHEVALECARQAFANLFAQNVSVEPTYQSCSGSTFTNPFLSSNRYQIGADILWEREF